MTKIDMGNKLNFIHVVQQWNKSKLKAKLTLPSGEVRDAQKEVMLLGITLDHALTFKSHILKKIGIGRQSVGAIWRLGGTQVGTRESAVRSLYTACVRPIVEYGLRSLASSHFQV